MSEETEQVKWAANIAITGDKGTVKNIIKFIEEQEEKSLLKEVTLIEGPYANSVDQTKK